MFNKKYSIVVGVLLFLPVFIFATAASQPTNVVFNNNVTPLYDEGSFIVNWTNASTDTGYTIYIWMNDVLVNTSASNNSATAMTFVNSTEANYTFTVEALNGTTGFSANASNVSMYIDTTAPVINLVDYTNATLKNATSTLELNISVSDLLSGETGSFCLIDVNGTNQSIAVSGGWCNSTSFNLTGLSDGNHTIGIHVNDTVNNFGVNNSRFVWMDSTVPSTTLSLTSAFPTSINLAFTTSEGTCTSNRGTVSGSTIVDTGLSCANSYSYSLTCIDSTGNRASRTASYSTLGCSGIGSSTSFEGATFVLSDAQFIEGFAKDLPVGDRVKFKSNNENHYVEVLALTANTAKIEMSSEPQQATLNVGDSRKFEINGDNFYDVLVTLNSIVSNKASITTMSINEEITSESVIEEEEKEEIASEGAEEIEDVGGVPEEKRNLVALWIVIGLVFIIIVWYLFRNKLKR